jgi:hypothetical protein
LSTYDMSPVLSPAPPQAAPTRVGRNVVALLVGGLVAVAVILGVSSALEGPALVDRVTIDNPTPYPLEVEVGGLDGGGRLALGPVASGERHAFASVVDQGDRWVVHVTSARSDGGEIVLSRNDLERNDWVITISDEVGAKLGAAGATPRTDSE